MSAKELFAFLALDRNVGETRADATSCQTVNVLILKLVDTYVVESSRINFVACFIVDAHKFLGADVEYYLAFLNHFLIKLL